MSTIAVNYTKTEIGNDAVSALVAKMQPNILERYNIALQKVKSYSLLTNDPLDIARAGVLGSHAEVIALNDLATDKFGNEYVDPQIFDDWLKNDVLGYVRHINPNKGNCIQPTCIHCFYFTYLVTFMRIS